MRNIEQIKKRCQEVTKYNNRPDWSFIGKFEWQNVYRNKSGDLYKLDSMRKGKTFDNYTYTEKGILNELANGAGLMSREYKDALAFIKQEVN